MPERTPEPTWQVERVPTGVPHLDSLLDGGLTRGSLVYVVGGPGTGKTVLAEQIAFHWAAQGQSTLWLITLGEPNEKFLTHLSEMRFYDHRYIGAEIQLVNLTRFLAQGLEEKMDAIRETLRSGAYSFLVLDGFQSLRAFLDGPREVRFFLSELGSELALSGTTLIVTADSDPRRYWEGAEFTLADCIIALSREVVDSRERRSLQVLKLRGRSVIGGPHAFSIDHSGISVHPRLESLQPPCCDLVGGPRLSSGVRGLDRLLRGGLLTGTATLIVGSPGTGKSVLADHFLAESLRRAEPALRVSFFENIQRLLERSDAFRLPLRQGYESGLLTIWCSSPQACEPDACAEEIFRTVRDRGIRRLAIDGIDPFEHELSASRRTLSYLDALISELGRQGVTTLLTHELPTLLGPWVSFTGPIMGQVAANLILLRLEEREGRLRRLLSIVKTRYSDHSTATAELMLSEGQASVVPAHEPVEEEVTGHLVLERRGMGPA